MKRIDFLNHFLGALGAIDIVYGEVHQNHIEGTVIYETDDPEENQDFIWYASEYDVPSENAIKLIKLLHEKKLLDIDRITISRDALRKLFNNYYDLIIDKQSFDKHVDSLEEVNVKMVDEGKETDSYFIHE